MNSRPTPAGSSAAIPPTAPEEAGRPSASGPAASFDARFVAAVAVVFGVLSLGLSVTSPGFLAGDGKTHYLYARFALQDPTLLTNVWGRPVVTLLHTLPAQLPGSLLGQPLGLIGVRAVSMLLAIGCGLMAWRVAVGLGPAGGHDRPGLAVLFLLGMPLVLLHSISELTELPFAFLAICGLWAYQSRRWLLLALLAGLLPAARPEGFGLLLLAAAGLVLHRRIAALLILPLPLVLWDRLGWWQSGQPGPAWHLFAWLWRSWPYSAQSTYEAGPLLKFAGMLPAVVGPLVMPMVLVGLLVSLRGFAGWRDHRRRVAWCIAVVPLGVLIVHSLLHWLGRMASSGDVRYLVAVTPFWALLAARGWDWLSTRLAWRRNYPWATLAAVAPLVVLQLVYPVMPLKHDPAALDALAVARWYDQSDYARTHPRLITDHPLVWFARDMHPTSSGAGREPVMSPQPGTLFLWNQIYSTHNADAQLVVEADLPLRHGWIDVTPREFPAGWRVFMRD